MTTAGNKATTLRFFLIKAAVLVLMVFIMDFAIGKTLRYFYFKQKSGEQFLAIYAIDSTRQDLLIFGSSRANHHYEPGVFKQQLNFSYYNVGRDGSSIFYHYAVLKSVLKRYQPKVIILDFMKQEFELSAYAYDRLSILLPFYKNHPEMRPILAYRSKYEKIKMVSSIYPFNSAILTIAAGNAKFNVQRKDNESGYVGLHKTWQGTSPAKRINSDYEFDTTAVNMYKNFIADCKAAGVSLFVVCSPYLYPGNNADKSLTLARAIALENGIPFFDYSAEQIFLNNNNLFSDPDHLNDSGAVVFSRQLLEEVKATNKIKRLSHK